MGHASPDTSEEPSGLVPDPVRDACLAGVGDFESGLDDTEGEIVVLSGTAEGQVKAPKLQSHLSTDTEASPIKMGWQ